MPQNSLHPSLWSWYNHGTWGVQNHWKAKTVETRPDGSEHVVYTNYIGQIVIKELRSGSDRWIEYRRYDGEGLDTSQVSDAPSGWTHPHRARPVPSSRQLQRVVQITWLDPSGLTGDTSGQVRKADVRWCKDLCRRKSKAYSHVTKPVLNLGVCKLYFRRSHCKPRPTCKPCIPPVGTVAFEVGTGRPHAGAEVHIHIFEMNQNPDNCRCFWTRRTKEGNVPPPGAIPFPGRAQGGGEL